MENVLKDLGNGGTLVKAAYRRWSQGKNGEEVRHAIVDAWWYTPEGIPCNGSWHAHAEGIYPWPEWFVSLGSVLNVGPTRDVFFGPKKFPSLGEARQVPCASRGAAATFPLASCPHCNAPYVADPTSGVSVHADEGFGTTAYLDFPRGR